MSNGIQHRVAIVFQAQPPPARNGIRKPMKPGGYSDSGADIACALINSGVDVVLPVEQPNLTNDKDWVFPDTRTGIQEALDRGATTLWLNTVLYEGHAIEHFHAHALRLIGQTPKSVDVHDDKWVTNAQLREHGLPIPNSVLIRPDDVPNLQKTDFPLVIKAIRGRGSQGVVVLRSEAELERVSRQLFDARTYGDTMYIEPFLPGEEVTISVMPPGSYHLNDAQQTFDTHWCLPAVRRFNHVDGVAPYNGVVAVVHNSRVLDHETLRTRAIVELNEHCVKAAHIVGAKAPIRIDCRADADGHYSIFDLNMKPNMTGASRPHRTDQDSLTAIAARKIGWRYADLIMNIYTQSWPISDIDLHQ